MKSQDCCAPGALPVPVLTHTSDFPWASWAAASVGSSQGFCSPTLTNPYFGGHSFLGVSFLQHLCPSLSLHPQSLTSEPVCVLLDFAYYHLALSQSLAFSVSTLALLAHDALTSYGGDHDNAATALLQHGQGGGTQDHVADEVDLQGFAHRLDIIAEETQRGVSDVVEDKHVQSTCREMPGLRETTQGPSCSFPTPEML